jgi:hypothetical protein
MNGWPDRPSASAVGPRKNEPMIAPPNQTIADPTGKIRRMMSNPSITWPPAAT